MWCTAENREVRYHNNYESHTSTSKLGPGKFGPGKLGSLLK